MKKLTTLLTALALVPALLSAQQNVSLVAPKKQSYTPLSQLQPGDYLPNTMILKVLPQHRGLCLDGAINIPAVGSYLGHIGATQVQKMFPNHQPPERPFNDYGAPMIDLSLIYTVKYSGGVELEKAIGKLFNMGYFEYVEPYFVPKVEITTNDPAATSSGQYHLFKIVAAGTGTTGWDISQGDTNQVIGITDTGVELAHSDLQGNIKYNYADPINGSDDDSDGFIDNYRGWDVGMNDNDPTWQSNAHGVHVSGCSSAHTNNGVGVAGSGYKCKFLPIKIADASGALIASYQGITYAADHGCSVVNCSWGGTGGGSFGQNIIDYAVNNQDMLVVAAAGNNSADQAFYPAAYDRVLSVASTSSTDNKSSFSNYNYTVDVCAPGSSINATWSGNTFTTSSGTSMASPVCAGAAGIVRSYYPGYTALQVGERLKMTSDNIYSVGGNGSYPDKLGRGRINLYRALTDPNGPSVVFQNKLTTDGNDNAFVIGDTMKISGDFFNYLGPTTNLTATLAVQTGGAFVTILDNSTTPGAIGTMNFVNNASDPFRVRINSNAPANQAITFRLTLTDGAWTINQYFTEVVNVDYINVTVNDVFTSITSKGLIGYNMDQQQQGLGFTYQGSGSLLYEASLMVGTSGTKVSDMARGTGTTPDADFASLVTVHRVIPDVVSDFDLDGKFRDNIAPSPLPVTVHHQCYAWAAAPHQKYVIVQYVITNTSGSTLSNLHAGIFADWDIDATTYNDNEAGEDTPNKMGYVYHTATAGLYCGTKLLTSTAPFHHYAIDNINGGGGGVDLYNGGYDGTEKFTTLSTNRAQAGTTGAGNDVCDVVSTGPYTVNPGDSIVVAFALIAGDDLTDIQNSAVDAQTMYDTQVPLGVKNAEMSLVGSLSQSFPNPATGNATILFNLPASGKAELKLFDVTGREVAVLASGEMAAGTHQVNVDASRLASGIYYYQLQTAGGKVSKKMIVSR